MLAFAWRKTENRENDPEHDMTLLGLVGLEDPPRPEVPEIIFARVGADQKLRIITALQKKGKPSRSPATASTMRRR